MSGQLSPGASLDSLRKEAKRWLRALGARDEQARARLAGAWPKAPATPGLRDVQHALALEHGFPSWAHLKARVAEVQRQRTGDARTAAFRALLLAAGRGELDRVVQILDAHPDLVNEHNLPDDTGRRTALHFAVAHAPVVRALLDRGADPNVRDNGDNAFPLHFAAERQDLPVIRLLIEHGADPIGTGDDHELDVIGWATAFDYLTPKPEVVEYLLSHGARHNIFSAVTLGEVETIRALVAQTPADLDRPMDRTNHRRRPLHLAVVKKQPSALAVLMELGADLEALDAAGLTALDKAALDNETAMAQALIDRGAAIRLPAAVALGRTSDIERALGDDPDCLEPGGRFGTLIVRAAEHATTEVIETLIEFGASPNVLDDAETSIDSVAGYTPLHGAASRGRAEAVAVLLKHGAKPSIRDEKFCSTPAGWADYFGHSHARDLILAGPIDIFEAVSFERIDRIADILERDPGALERPFGDYPSFSIVQHGMAHAAWRTPLAWAVFGNLAESARLLLARGANQTVSPEGRTLSDLASEKGREAVAAVLHEQVARERG